MQLKDLVTKQDAMGPLLDMGALQASSIMVTLPAPLAGVSLIPRATASPSMTVVIVAGISTKQSSCTGSLHQEEALTFHPRSQGASDGVDREDPLSSERMPRGVSPGHTVEISPAH